jgi:hypothetical protein
MLSLIIIMLPSTLPLFLSSPVTTKPGQSSSQPTLKYQPLQYQPMNELRTMQIVQMFAQQDVMPLYRALLYTVNGCTTYKASTSTEEEVGIVKRELR